MAFQNAGPPTTRLGRTVCLMSVMIFSQIFSLRIAQVVQRL